MSASSADTFAATIVGGVDVQDSHRVVRLLTEQGRLAVFAPGAKRSKRRFAGGLEPFTRINATISLARRRQGMATLTEATIDKPRLSLRRDLSVMALASYITELSDRVAPEEAPCEAQFELLEEALDILESEPATVALRRRFELRLAVELGYEPEVRCCVVCGTVPEPPYFDLGLGGIRCLEHKEHATEIGPKTWAWLSAVLQQPNLQPMDGFEPLWSKTAAERLSRTSTGFVEDLVSWPLKSVSLLATVDLQ